MLPLVKPKKKQSQRKSVNPREDEIQAALIQWAAYHPILKHYLYHIPNGGYDFNKAFLCQHCNKYSKVTNHQYWTPWMRSKLLKIGLKPGMPDIHIAYSASGYHGLFGELKAKGKKASEEQIEVMTHLVKANFAVYLWDDLDTCMKDIEGYLNGKAHESKQWKLSEM